MQAVEIHDIGPRDIKKYLSVVGPMEIDSPEWVKDTVDSSTVSILLTSGSFSKARSAYGAFVGNTMIGYAVSYDPKAHLDLLHVHPEYRGRGVAQELIGVAGSRSVVVQPGNKPAVKLYQKLGLEIEYDEVY